MLLRRFVPVALGTLALLGCEPSVPRGASSATVDRVLFDPASARIPSPNDLALQMASALPSTDPQGALLKLFAAQGGFPNDQEVPIEIEVQHTVFGANVPETSAPPPIDPSSLDPTTLLALETDLATGVTVPVPALEPGYTVAPDHGRLVLRNPPWSYDPADPGKTTRRWKANHRYAVILRGGPNGAKLAGGGELAAAPALFLLTEGVADGQELPGASLTLPQNQYLLPGGSRDARAQAGAQLEQLRQAYLPLFALADATWGAGGAQQIVSIQTFTVAPLTSAQLVAATTP